MTKKANVGAALVLGYQAITSASGASGPTFNKEVAPILFQHCVICHRPGEIASSVGLVTYDSARPWAKSIKEKVITREMPPWSADPGESLKFRNDARLSSKEIQTLVAWVDAGAQKGSDADLPPLPTFPQGWLNPKGPPDLVLSLPGDFALPARGQLPYVRYLARVPFSGDKWIAALQVRPGNRAVVHHMAITEVRLEDGTSVDDLGAFATLARQMGLLNSLPGVSPAVTDPSNPAAFDMLGVYTPGSTLELYGDDSAKLLKGGKSFYINFNIHYQPSGKAEKDRSMIAFWFQPGPPKHQLFRVPGAGKTIIVNGTELLSDAPGKNSEGTGAAIPPIPPGAENYEVTGITAYPEPITIYQLQPHAHVRCKDFKYSVIYPDGREQTVLSVPKYNFEWQLAYELETPLKLPAGSKLVVTAHYDNSPNNKSNPAPDREVYFRDGENQSWDEMFTPFIQYSIDTQDLTLLATNSERREEAKQNNLHVVEVEGCLERSAAAWSLTNATDPLASETQATSSVALRSAKVRALGNRRYQLLGVNIFNPSDYKGDKVAVKGILIEATQRLNVTSLQMAGTGCAKGLGPHP